METSLIQVGDLFAPFIAFVVALLLLVLGIGVVIILIKGILPALFGGDSKNIGMLFLLLAGFLIVEGLLVWPALTMWQDVYKIEKHSNGDLTFINPYYSTIHHLKSSTPRKVTLALYEFWSIDVRYSQSTDLKGSYFKVEPDNQDPFQFETLQSPEVEKALGYTTESKCGVPGDGLLTFDKHTFTPEGPHCPEKEGSQPQAKTTPSYAVGNLVEVLWKGKWFKAKVLEVKPNQWLIGYEGYDESWNEWVGQDRIKPRNN